MVRYFISPGLWAPASPHSELHLHCPIMGQPIPTTGSLHLLLDVLERFTILNHMISQDII